MAEERQETGHVQPQAMPLVQERRHPGQVADVDKHLPRKSDAQQQHGALGEHVLQDFGDARPRISQAVGCIAGAGRIAHPPEEHPGHHDPTSAEYKERAAPTVPLADCRRERAGDNADVQGSLVDRHGQGAGLLVELGD